MTFTIGCDPEVFIRKKNTSRIISVHETGLPGTKESPHKTQYGALQQDGLAAEFNVDPAVLAVGWNGTTGFEIFNRNIVRTLAELKAMTNGMLEITPVAEFNQEYMDSLPESTKELGCDPDYSAYTMEANPRPDGTRLFRTAAGHIHYGWAEGIPVENEEHFEICANFVKMLDATVGMFMTILDRDPRRRDLYGKAGAFRPKSYGVEYRTPSNVWIKNKTCRKIIYDLSNVAIQNMKHGFSPTRYWNGASPEEIINTGDYENARDLLFMKCNYSLRHRIFKIYNEVTAAAEKVKEEA